MTPRPLIASAACAALLGGCAVATAPHAPTVTQAVFPAKTPTQAALNAVPPPTHPVAVAVYGFADQTGQFKTTDTGQTLSRAITQGGGSILVKALQDAGERKWFTVVEREQLKDLLNERQIISEMRARYLGEATVNPKALPALLFAGVLLEGGVVSYDSNTMTSGAGASVLGIGVDGKLKQDTVTVYLRAVSVKTGEILTTVTASKTITSRALDANLFAYVAADKIGQGELGYTTNEPGQLALQQAIEKAVYGLIFEGVDLKLWSFADADAGWPMLWRYKQERDGVLSAAQAAALTAKARPKTVGQASPALLNLFGAKPRSPEPAVAQLQSPPPLRSAGADGPKAQPPAASGGAGPAPQNQTTTAAIPAGKGE